MPRKAKVLIYIPPKKKKRPGVHSKNASKNQVGYKKKYRGQGIKRQIKRKERKRTKRKKRKNPLQKKETIMLSDPTIFLLKFSNFYRRFTATFCKYKNIS